jgi:hypothetical protein
VSNRIIKESICVSRKINELSAEEEVFFYRLLVNCDDYGCFFGDPDVLSAKLFPRRRYSDEKIRRWRDRLCTVGLIRKYRAEEADYIHVNKWDENQQVRARRHKFPVYTESISDAGNGYDLISDDGNGYHLISDDINCNQLSLAPAESESLSLSESLSESKGYTPTPQPDIKRVFGEFNNVLLTDEEHRKLVERLSESGTQELITRLSGYIASKGVKYRSHFATILNWKRKDSESRPPGVSNRANFDQRDYTDEQLRNLYDEPPAVDLEEEKA